MAQVVNLSVFVGYQARGLVGAIVAATIPLARSAGLSPFIAIVGLASVRILWRVKVGTVWLVLAAGAVGWL